MPDETTPIPGSDPLFQLAANLDLKAVGDGNLSVGANVLLAMCVTLCVLESPGRIAHDPKVGLSLPLELNLLGCDPTTNRLIDSLVIKPIKELQNIHLSNAAGVVENKHRHEEAAKRANLMPSNLLEAAKRLSGTLLHESDHHPDQFGPVEFFEEKEAPLRDLAFTHPRFSVGAMTERTLTEELEAAHRGHVLAFPRFSRIEEVESLDAILNGLMAGNHMSAGNAFETEVGGNVIGTITGPIRDAIADPGLCTATWPNQVFWLPSSLKWKLTSQAESSKVYPFDLVGSYRKALKAILNGRLGAVKQPVHSYEGFHKIHRQTLSDIRRVPGIDAAYVEICAPLLSILWHGMRIVARAAGKMPRGYAEAVMTLALALSASSWRMLSELRRRSEIAARRSLANSILTKLALENEPVSHRKIIRRFRRLNTDLCLQMLGFLESLGLVESEEGLWKASDSRDDAWKRISNSNPIFDV